MRVMKFGGAVMRNPEGFAAMTEILRQYRNEPLLVVVSAFSTVTRDLRRAAALAEQGDEHSALAQAEAIITQHETFARELLHDAITLDALSLLLRESGKRLREYIRGVAITRELTPRTLDAVLAYGEYLSVHIVKHYLQEQDFAPAFVDAADVVVTNDRYGAAIPNRERTAGNVEEKLLPLLQRGMMVITQGFVGRSTAGEVTTMGMESSNLTATLLAELLSASEVVIWTDVDGVRSADPRYAEGTAAVSQLSYAQASTAAANGVKLLHPSMIEPVQRASIPLFIRSAFAPGRSGTMITRATPAFIPPILSLRRITVLHIERTHDQAASLLLPDTLVRNPQQVLSYSIRPDSLCLLAFCSVAELNLHTLPADVSLQTWADYALISIIGEQPTTALHAITQCNDLLSAVRLPLVETGTQNSVARIAVPIQQSEPLFQRLHDLLLHNRPEYRGH